ncbi:hypothetical protein DW026_11685 [Segatella copri]|uniref:Uncharacterized protein n=1 Tax=Segatella copri TaxID=165179 RepID=A0AA93BMM0_9BACT|nr:hypothetical protein DW026_11685 [Segatella copri]
MFLCFECKVTKKISAIKVLGDDFLGKIFFLMQKIFFLMQKIFSLRQKKFLFFPSRAYLIICV